MPCSDGQDDHPQKGRHHYIHEKTSAWGIPRFIGQACPAVQPFASQSESNEASKTKEIPHEE